MGRFSIHHILENERQEAEVFNGRLNTNKVVVFAKTYFTPEDVDEFFTCGSEPHDACCTGCFSGLRR